MHSATQSSGCSVSWCRINVLLSQMKIFPLSPEMSVNGILLSFSLKRWFLQRLSTRPTIRSYSPSLRPSRLGTTTWGFANTKASSSLRITISAYSWIPRAWVPSRSDRSRNSLGTTFKLTCARERPIPPLMPCLASPRGARPRKRPFELRIPRFFTLTVLANQCQSSRL